MVGLSVVLEGHHHTHHKTTAAADAAVRTTKVSSTNSHQHPQVISKTSLPASAMAIHPTATPSSSSFLERCFLCNTKLLPAKDIYMYKGDRAFCSVECRCRQIFMDDQEETLNKKNCSMAAASVKPATGSTATPSSASSSRSRRSTKNHRAGGFAY